MTPLGKGGPEVNLGDICEFKYGKSLPADKRAGGAVHVFGSNGVVGYHDEGITTGATIIVGRKGSLGEVTYSSSSCWPIDTTYYIDSTATDADLRWLVHCLRSLKLTSLNRAAAVPGLNREDAYRLRVLLPPLPEQRRIATLLDQAETLLAKRRTALSQLDQLTRAIFLEMFGDPIQNQKNIPVVPLGDHLLFVTSGGRGWAKYYTPSGSRFIRSLDVQMNHICDEDSAFVVPPNNAEARRTKVRSGDVLLTITGSRIGRVAPVPKEMEDAYISQHVAILRANPEDLAPTFLSYFLSLDAGGQRQIAAAQYGQTKPGLNFEQIKRFQILLPSLPLQREFARRAAAVERLKAVQRASLAILNALIASLQHRAFRGEL